MLKEYNVIIESISSEWFLVTVPELPNCAAKGKTIKEALINAKKSIEYCAEYPLEKCLLDGNFFNYNNKLDEIKNIGDDKDMLSIIVYLNPFNALNG
jgi:predicted RNase H-like HicB family nuclease